MATFVNTFFEERLEDLFGLADKLETALSAAGIDYRVVGGLATYLYVEEADPDAGRLTRDIDVTVRREDLDRIKQAVEPFGLRYRNAAGVDLLIQQDQPARRAIHLVFSGEKVRPDYVEPAPALGPARTIRGFRLIALADLVRMKLTSFRAKDEMHLKDMDEAGLITPEIEADLSPILRDRLNQARARD